MTLVPTLRAGPGSALAWLSVADLEPVCTTPVPGAAFSYEENLDDDPDEQQPWQSVIANHSGGYGEPSVLTLSAARGLPLRLSPAYQPTGPPAL